MQISESWLRELVNPTAAIDQLVEQLTMAGLEVDSVEPVAGQFNNVIVAQVVSVVQHPNADKLKVCQVDIGGAEPLQIVCGANNVRADLKVPAALVGAVLPGDFKIKKSKLRGEDSAGMLCSASELGLAEESDGLLELPENAPIGVDIREYLQLNDNIIEVDLTPNRADCLSVEGLAREVALLNEMPWTAVAFETAEVTSAQVLDVITEEPAACPAYLGRLIENVNPTAETPLWMQERLRRSGLRSLGPLIDVTNYVLLELGQPLHAFDAVKLLGAIVVRKSRAQERIKLLNDQEIELDSETLVIADQQQALALAGVMGGADSAVSDTTTRIFLECAFFSPVAIAGKARQYGLHTDSSHRFERGVDFTLQQRAIERATQLIIDICGGKAGPITKNEFLEYLPQRTPVTLRQARIAKMLGVDIAKQEIMAIFQGLGMQIRETSDGWEVTPPGYRFDIAIEADLIEELARVYGYNNVPNQQLLLRSELGRVSETSLTLDRVKDLLVDKGYQETISYSFVAKDMQHAIAPDEKYVQLQNPISADLAVMRTTLWCGLINSALYNTNRQQNRLKIFESGLRFIDQANAIQQQAMLAGLALGSVFEEQWGEKTRKLDFFDVKADLEAIFTLANASITFKAEQHPALHPGQSARLYNQNNDAVGWLGMLHPVLEKQFGFDQQVFLFELELSHILQKQIPVFRSLSKYPSVKRDLSIVVKDDVSVDSVFQCIQGCDEKIIQTVRLFDIYQGAGVESGFKSLALSLTLQDMTQTLEDSVIDAILNRVLKALETNLGGKLRG